jgi:hypothetical protein
MAENGPLAAVNIDTATARDRSAKSDERNGGYCAAPSVSVHRPGRHAALIGGCGFIFSPRSVDRAFSTTPLRYRGSEHPFCFISGVA